MRYAGGAVPVTAPLALSTLCEIAQLAERMVVTHRQRRFEPFSRSCHLGGWCQWQARRTPNPQVGVRIPVSPHLFGSVVITANTPVLHTGDPGSNPGGSTIFPGSWCRPFGVRLNPVSLGSSHRPFGSWPDRLLVRTDGFQPSGQSSILCRATQILLPS